MSTNTYIEDIFMKFFIAMSHNGVGMLPRDTDAASSFYMSLLEGDDITEKQGTYILKILNKYSDTCAPYYDYRQLLANPKWKKPFRIVDYRKQIWVERDDSDVLWICLKFPFQFKETFDAQIANTSSYASGITVWDRQRRIRKLFLYDYNIIRIVEFCREHGFEIADTAVEAVSAVEEIWNNQEQYLRTSRIEDGRVVLSNASEEALEYFREHGTGNTMSNLILAKNLGYVYSGRGSSMIERIASSHTNTFHIKSLKDFLGLCYEVEGKIVILLDKTEQSINWVRGLARVIRENKHDAKDFRVCFRTSNSLDPDFNKWVNENGFGGKISDAKFLIFREKPAKWLFKQEKDAIIVASNDLLPGLNGSARSMLKSHPCVIYISEYKPVKQHGETIIEL